MADEVGQGQEQEGQEQELVKIKIELQVAPDMAQPVAFEMRKQIRKLKQVTGYSLFIVRNPEDEPE